MEKENRKPRIRTNHRFGLTLPAIAVSMFFCGTGIEAASFQDRVTDLQAEDSLRNDGHAGGKRFAVTALSANCLREEPDFAAELGNQLLMGTPVTIADSSGYWRQVVSPDPYKAWCVDKSLTEMDRNGLERYIAAPKLRDTSLPRNTSLPDGTDIFMTGRTKIRDGFPTSSPETC